MRRKTEVAFEVLNIISSILIIALFLYVMIGALNYWVFELDVLAKNNASPRQIMFWLAIMIAFITVMAQWIEGRLVSFIRSMKVIRRSDGRRKEREEDSGISASYHPNRPGFSGGGIREPNLSGRNVSRTC